MKTLAPVAVWAAALLLFTVAGVDRASADDPPPEPKPPTEPEQRRLLNWLRDCDLNGDPASFTCAEAERCLETRVDKKDHPLLYEFMRDPDRDGVVCEHLPPKDGKAPKATNPQDDRREAARVFFGAGLVAGLSDRGRDLGAEFQGEKTRPVATAAYVFGPRLGTKKEDGAAARLAALAVLDIGISIDGEGGMLDPRGVGLGFGLSFLGDDAKQAFGIGVVHMWESAKIEVEERFVERTDNSVLLLVTYTFGRKWWPQ